MGNPREFNLRNTVMPIIIRLSNMDKAVQSRPCRSMRPAHPISLQRASLYLALITASPVKPKSIINTFELCSIDKSSNQQQSGLGTGTRHLAD